MFEDIISVGIDDFAIKKRHTYGTVMVNQANHQIISMINSRDIGEVSLWLKQYPNLKYVSRDGSLIYKSAIELANPKIIQISDRFHLIKGLSEAINDEMKNIIPRIFVLETIKTSFDNKTLKEKFYKAKIDIENGLSFTASCNKNGIMFTTMKKLMQFNQYELENYFENKTLKRRLSKIEEKNKTVEKINELKSNGYQLVKFLDKLDLIGVLSKNI